MRRLVLPLLLSFLAGCGAVEQLSSQGGNGYSYHYDVQPDSRACQTGTLKESERQEVLTRLNEIRALHGLPAVTYAPTWNPLVDHAALMMVAAGTLSHAPPTAWPCYTAEGAAGAGSSNLSLRTHSVDVTSYSFLVGWLIDDHDISGGTGHRQWLLDPFMASVAFGRVDGPSARGDTTLSGAALRVVGATQSAGNMVNDFVAYPHGDYPADLVNTGYWLSFSPIASRNGAGGANAAIDLSLAGVTMTAPNGVVVPVTATTYENSVGSPLGAVRWKASITTGITYTVTVSGLKVNNVYRTYTYTFRLV